MGKISLAEKIRYALVSPHYPNVGIEFNSDAIRLAVVAADNGRISVQHLDAEELPPGVLEVTPFKANIISLEVVADALRRLWSRNRFKSSKVCILIQDRSALAFHLTMEHAAKDAAECLDLIRFKLKKNVPFKIEDAQIGYFNPAGAPDPSSDVLWAVVVNHVVLHQYEEFVRSSIDAECGLIDLSTLNLLSLAHVDIRNKAMADQDLLFVNVNRDYVSLAITQKSKLVAFRTRALEGQDSMIKAAMEEIHPTAMYYVDKLGGQKFSRAYVFALNEATELSQAIEHELNVPTSSFALDSYAGARFDPSNGNFIDKFAPLAGLLISRKVEFQ